MKRWRLVFTIEKFLDTVDQREAQEIFRKEREDFQLRNFFVRDQRLSKESAYEYSDE